ncbi:MAG: alpha/beta fold hydrolase [Burkholderiaceae bacterium]|jgi:polyhydroxyalkanoate synthase|nr:alpha/beta fold hydrolase [Burkholderiaceae bacterium]
MASRKPSSTRTAAHARRRPSSAAASAAPKNAPAPAADQPLASKPPVTESPTERLDRLVQTAVSQRVGNLSPIALGLALADWGWHLAASPGRQMELAALAARLTREALNPPPEGEGIGARDADPRFRHEDWAQWPFSLLRSSFRSTQSFWQEAACLRGVSEHNTDLVDFFARQWLGMLTPANWPLTNPVVLKDIVASRGLHLAQGAMNWLADITGQPTAADIANAGRFQVGKDVAVTPGKVVYRNNLIELIRYAPQTPKAHPEPLLIVPSWIMKYYILDLSPHNSMARYLVGQGHTVYMMSWRNPDENDRDLTLDDYLKHGVLDAMAAAGENSGAQRIHAAGYCLGGTLLAMAAAALARRDGVAGWRHLPALQSLSLLAGQVDFSEPGELGRFIDAGQVSLLERLTRGQGFLTGKQMAGSFQFLHSRDLVWTRQMREYLMGEREQPNDLMAWNADTTRLPARMHHEYLVALYLKNAFANGRYLIDGQPISLSDMQMPVFMVGTERDHVSPWRSVYKLHKLYQGEITFALTSGGHNAGIISEPGHRNRNYRIATRPAAGPWQSASTWYAGATQREGSWWPAWQQWLAERSSPPVKATPIPESSTLCDAPGTYVMKKYVE